MDKVVKSKLRFINYQIKEVVLKQNDKFTNDKEEIDIDFDLKHTTNISDNRMKIKLEIIVFDEAEAKNYPFYMKTVLEGNFAIEGEDIEKFEINGISLLYPYVRAIISTYTANSNIPTLILPPINVIEYYKKRKGLDK
ncbi:MAG: hypothetical protein HFJ47_00200 [Clostridia bacterium]|nr:hypothetical protein [Clostridia bacterium]